MTRQTIFSCAKSCQLSLQHETKEQRVMEKKQNKTKTEMLRKKRTRKHKHNTASIWRHTAYEGQYEYSG